MAQPKERKHHFRALKIYRRDDYERFNEMCHADCTTTTRVLNQFIAEAVKRGRLEVWNGN